MCMIWHVIFFLNSMPYTIFSITEQHVVCSTPVLHCLCLSGKGMLWESSGWTEHVINISDSLYRQRTLSRCKELIKISCACCCVPQLECGGLGCVQSQLQIWRADQTGALSSENRPWSGGHSDWWPVCTTTAVSQTDLQHTHLPTGLEHWTLVSG